MTFGVGSSERGHHEHGRVRHTGVDTIVLLQKFAASSFLAAEKASLRPRHLHSDDGQFDKRPLQHTRQVCTPSIRTRPKTSTHEVLHLGCRGPARSGVRGMQRASDCEEPWPVARNVHVCECVCNLRAPEPASAGGVNQMPAY